MIFNFCTILISPPASVGWSIYRNKNNDKSMNNNTPQQATGASETARYFCTRISPAAGAADEFVHNKKERSPTWAKEVPIHGRGNVPVTRNPDPKPHKTPKSIQPQKQHNTAIKFPLFLGSRPWSSKWEFDSEWFPLPLRKDENMVWTDSQEYGVDEILHISKKRYFAKSPESQAKLPLFSESHPDYSKSHAAIIPQSRR